MSKEETNFETGADWWREKLSRREANKRLASVGALAAVLAASGVLQGCDEDEEEIIRDTTELQREQGWNVGATDKTLTLDGKTSADSTGSIGWATYLDPQNLLKAYEPMNSKWKPFVVPTLVQSLSQPTLRSQLAPVVTPAMKEAYAKGLGMREIVRQSKNPESVVIVADLVGIESVAFGAALADVADVVLGFDNWPHPLGVVPSQQTLGALIYYAEEVAQKSKKRTGNPPAVMLLDSNRLLPYNDATDGDTKFDNRCIAKLPTAENLASAGAKSVLYCTPDSTRTTELDDLNDDFATYKEKGLAISMVNLSEFKPAQASVAPVTPGGKLPALQGDSLTRAMNGTTAAAPVNTTTTYYYGGSPSFAPWFFYHYPIFYPSPIYYPSYSPSYYSSRVSPVSRPSSYTPVRRPTMFSSRTTGGALGVGKTRPSGFGRVSTRVSSSGTLTGVRSGRSGSFGRSGGFFSS